MRLLHGRPLAERLAARSRERSAALLGRGIHPALTVISVGIDSAANTYLLRLVRGGEALDITVRDASLHRDATEQAVSAELDRASRDPAVHGVLLLTPLPGKLDEGQLVDHIAAQKDVEGVNPYNVGLAQGGRQRFVPTTAEAIVELLKFHDIPLAGADVVVVGRSTVVGRPAAALLLNEDATVTIAHKRTSDVGRAFVRDGDRRILVQEQRGGRSTHDGAAADDDDVRARERNRVKPEELDDRFGGRRDEVRAANLQ